MFRARAHPWGAALLLALTLWRPQAAQAVEAGALCGLIADSATAHDLPDAFLARLIWTESRFDVKALSPAGAQGVAQFMPETARLRGLSDPWNPAEAIPAAAAYLSDLRKKFGDLGRAAAAYNAGENRVERWLAGVSGLPAETRAYVRQITFQDAESFRPAPRALPPRPLEAGRSFAESCKDLPVIATRALGRSRSPWAAQLAGATSRASAWGAWRRLKRLHPGVLERYAPEIMRNRHRRRGALWQVRIGAASFRQAQRICAALRASGAACVTAKN